MYLQVRPLSRAVLAAEHEFPSPLTAPPGAWYLQQRYTNMDRQRQLSPDMVPRAPGCISALARLLRIERGGRNPSAPSGPKQTLDDTKLETSSSSGDEIAEVSTRPPSTTQTSELNRRLSLRDRIPKGSWDSHMHVIDPETYPLSPHALYTPPRAYLLSDAQSFHASLGLDKTVFVQPSIYGNDNSCLLAALRALGPHRAAGVVTFEPGNIPLRTLREWHALGVRAVRVNLASVGRDVTSPELERLLLDYAKDCAPLGWSVQIYLPMRTIELLEPVVPKLAEVGVRVCIDHIGHPSLDEAAMPLTGRGIDPYRMCGFRSLVNLLQQGNTFVKLSAPYRFLSNDPEGVGPLGPVSRELLDVAGTTRVVFATDWPHTRFDGLDITSWVQAVLDWCEGDDKLVGRVFRGNADDLWADRSTIK